MNREAGLEYGFSWWRRAAAVAAAGTLSLSLVGCEKPADEQHVAQPEVVSTEDTSPVDGGLDTEASSKYPNIENTAGFSDDESLKVCFQGKEYALSWGDALILVVVGIKLPQKLTPRAVRAKDIRVMVGKKRIMVALICAFHASSLRERHITTLLMPTQMLLVGIIFVPWIKAELGRALASRRLATSTQVLTT